MFSYNRLYFSSVGCYFSFPICDFFGSFLSFYIFSFLNILFMYSCETQKGRGKWRRKMRLQWALCWTWFPRTPDHDLSESRCSTTEAPRCLADSISLLVMVLFIFSISSYFSFARLHISRDLSISSRSPSLLVYNLS